MRNWAICAAILAGPCFIGSAAAAENGTTLGHVHHARADEINMSLTALSRYPRLTEAKVAEAAKYRSAYDTQIPPRLKTFQASSVLKQ